MALASMTDNSLPGVKSAYLLRSGMGERHLVSGHLATVIARPQDTGGLMEAAVMSGGAGAAFPLHHHVRAHESLYVLDGQIELHLAGKMYLLSRGDYANLPPGTVHGYRMRDHYTRFLMWTVGGDNAKLMATLGQSYQGFVHPEGDPASLSKSSAKAAEASCDVLFVEEDLPSGVAASKFDSQVPPSAVVPYVLASGEGERLIAADQLFAFLAQQSNSDGNFITLTTLGPKGDRIPNHFHEKHTETFFCLDGAMTMWASDEEIHLLPGDFLHVPAGVIHSYRLDAPFTRFIGLLAPGLFEPFFRTLCDPYPHYIFPQSPKPLRFDRVIQKLSELDLKLVGPPGPPR